MPSRIRILLQHSGGTVYWGKRAVYQIFAMLPLGRAKVLREIKPTTLRLQEAMKLFPPAWVLTLIRETRGLRKNRSLYWKGKIASKLEEIEDEYVQFVPPLANRPAVVARIPGRRVGARPVRREEF